MECTRAGDVGRSVFGSVENFVQVSDESIDFVALNTLGRVRRVKILECRDDGDGIVLLGSNDTVFGRIASTLRDPRFCCKG